MANAISPTYSFILPEVGADTNAWGGHLNDNFTTIDTQMVSRTKLTSQTLLGPIALPSNGLNVGSGQLNVTGGNVSMSGNLTSVNGTHTGTLAVTGAATLSSTLAVTGAATFASTLGVTGIATFTVPVVASAVPTLGTHLTNKTYVDNANALKLNLAGGTMSGNLSIISGTTEMTLTLGSSAGYYFGNATTAGFKNSAGVARVSWNISSGDFTAAGNVTAYSDARLKENVQTIRDAVALVGRMRGVFYDRVDTGKAGVGVIAQEMQEIVPQVVIRNSDDTLSVAYGNLVGVLIEAVKELSVRVEALEAAQQARVEGK
jgi:hypothetical protein